MAVKISRITLVIRDHEISLTIDEAKELRRELGNLLGSETRSHTLFERVLREPWYLQPPHLHHWEVKMLNTGSGTAGSNAKLSLANAT